MRTILLFQADLSYACLSKQQVQPIPVYAIVYRHSIIHPSGVFDRLYPNEHSLVHPPRAIHV